MGMMDVTICDEGASSLRRAAYNLRTSGDGDLLHQVVDSEAKSTNNRHISFDAASMKNRRV
jgi:hypothetical protein